MLWIKELETWENFICVHFWHDIFNYPNPMKWIYQTGILDFANLIFHLEKNPVYQTQYFKLENWKNQVKIDRGSMLLIWFTYKLDGIISS